MRMILPLLAVSLITQVAEPTTTTVPLAAPLTLALDAAKAVGATVMRLGVDADDSVAPDEVQDVILALRGTKLFEIVSASEAKVVMRLSRIEKNIMLGTITSGTQRLWVGHVEWPPRGAVVAPTENAPPADSLRERVLQYERQKLSVRQAFAPVTGSPIPSGAPTWRWQWQDPAPSAPGEWIIVRGSARILSEDEFAKLIGDTGLAKKIEEERFWPRLGWGLTLGSIATAAAAGGAYATWRDNAGGSAAKRVERAVGISLLTVATAAAVIAFFPPSAPAHAFTPEEAELRCDTYNENLRKSLELTPSDIKDFGSR